jgi:Uma2 family endonuclease
MTQTLTTNPPKPFKRLYSLEEFFKMGELGLFKDQRVALIDGEVIVLPPRGKAHSQAVRRLTERLVLQFHARAFVSTQCPLILDGVSKIYLEPDLALLRLPQERYDDKFVEPADVQLVIEISDSTLSDDRTDKLKRYANNGILEYWILNVASNRLEVNREPEAGRYKTQLEFEAGQTVAPLEFPDAEIRWW